MKSACLGSLQQLEIDRKNEILPPARLLSVAITRNCQSKIWLVLGGFVLLAGTASLLFFHSVFNRSEEIDVAKSLIGRPWSEVQPRMGPATKIVQADDFNSGERVEIELSFKPRPVPTATGKVAIYNLMPTMIIVYEKDGVVSQVYVGGT